MDQYNWKEISFPSHQKDRKNFESNNKSIALNTLYVSHNTEEIKNAYVSKYNTNHENQIILLVITDGKKQHYLAVKKSSALLKGITSNYKGDFYCLIFFYSYTTKCKLEKHDEVCKSHDYCYVEIPNENNKILKWNYREKSMKVPFNIYNDFNI